MKNPFPALKGKFDRAVKDIRWDEVAEIGKDTINDVRQKPQEAFTLAAAAVIPGGAVAYAFHRMNEYKKKKKSANDNSR